MKIRIFSTLIIGCMLVLSAAVSGGCSDGSNEAKQLFVSQIRRCNRLNLGEMRISKTATIEDLKLSDADGPRQTVVALLDAVKVGDRKAVYSYDTYLTAFIDLSAFSENDVDIDTDAKRVRITLPSVQTHMSGRDVAVREDHYRVTGLRSQVSPAERAAVKEKMSRHLKDEIASDKRYSDILVGRAQQHAIEYFNNLLSHDGYTVEINFR